MEESKRQGLSKGCLIGLIVAGALLLLVDIIGVTCYVKRDDLMKFGVAQLMNSMKVEVATQQIPGVDTARFNGIADAFIAKLNSSEMQYLEYQKFMTLLQKATTDKEINSAEVDQLVDAMIAYYPELESLRLSEQPSAVPAVVDSGVPSGQALPK